MRSRLRYYSVATSLYKDNKRKSSSSLDVHTPDKPLSLCFNLVSEPSSSMPISIPLLGPPTKLRANAEVSAHKPSLPFPPVFILRRYRLRQEARDKPRTKTRTTPTSSGTTLEWRHADKRRWGTSLRKARFKSYTLSVPSINRRRLHEQAPD